MNLLCTHLLIVKLYSGRLRNERLSDFSKFWDIEELFRFSEEIQNAHFDKQQSQEDNGESYDSFKWFTDFLMEAAWLSTFSVVRTDEGLNKQKPN